MNLGEPIAVGNTAKIYRMGQTVVKLYDERLPNGEAAREAHKQRYAHALGLPVPQVLEVTEIEGRQALVMEHIKGPSLGELILCDISEAERYLELSAQIHKGIHSHHAAQGLEAMRDRLGAFIRAAQDLERREKAALLKALAGKTYEMRLCHGDFHAFNLIKAGDQVAIIDWVDATAGDIRADVCRSCLLYSQSYPDLAKLYLRLYCDIAGCSADHILAWMPIVAAARLAELQPPFERQRLLAIARGHAPW